MGKQPATVGGCRGLFCDFTSSFALAKQVDLAEKAFHDALARRNEAQIAYLREPSVVTREAFEGAKQPRQSRWKFSTQRSDGLPALAPRR
jgi:hypothetical protein